MAELFEQPVLHGSHKVIAKLSVALVAAQLLLGQDVVFLLAAVLFHGTDELITLEDGISLLVLNTRQLFFVREASILAPNGNGSLSQKAVHSIEDHSPITVSTLVSLRVPDQAVEHLLHELGIRLVTQIEHAIHVLVVLPAPLKEFDVIIDCSSQLSLSLPHNDLMQLVFLRRAIIANVHPATDSDLQSSLLELAHNLFEQASFGRSEALFSEAQVSLLSVSYSGVLIDFASKSEVYGLPQLSLALQQLLAPAVKTPQQLVLVVSSDPREGRGPNGKLVVAGLLHPLHEVRMDAPRKLILDGVAGADSVRAQDLL